MGISQPAEGRRLSQPDMRENLAAYVAGKSAAERVVYRNAVEFILQIVTEILPAPAADRDARYQIANAEGARRGLVVSGLPVTFDADAERYFRGFMPVVAAAEHVTRGEPTTH